jgi:hypothetical protein
MRIFLDDQRLPPQDGKGWVIVRSVGDAISWVEANGFPVFVSFDNDLGARQPEGRCFAAWLLELDMDSGNMPEDFAFYVHSQNVVAADPIRSRIDGHLAERTREKAAGRPWPPQRPREPWGRLG